MPRVAPDNNDVIVWLLNESGTPFVNSSPSTFSRGAAANLTIQVGTVVTGQESLFQQSCPYFPSFGNYPPGASATHNRLETAGGLAQDVPSPLSISAWVKVRSYVNLGDNFGFMLMKRYLNDGSWNSPYVAMDWTMWNSADGTWRAGCTVAGNRNDLLVNATNYPMPLGVWSHVGWTYDGVILLVYLNGVLAASVSPTGAPGQLDNSGHGPWAIGAAPESDGNKQEGAYSICDVRIANTIRPQSYFENIYRQGVLAF